MQRKKYLPSGLATLAVVVYLLRGELSDYMSSNFPEVEERGVLLGETVGLSGVDILRDADLSAAGMKGVDRYVEEVFRDIRMLAEYPRLRVDIVSAWLVNGTGSQPSRDSSADDEAAAAAASAAAAAASTLNAGHGESGGLASELTAEDMDLIDMLWRQDMDMGVGRETYDPVLRMEMEKERQLELKKQAEKEAAAAEASRKLLVSNFTVDPETGELVPLAAPCNGSAGVSCDEKAFETGFWSRPHFLVDETCSYSIDELLGENSAPASGDGGIQPAAASLPDQALYYDDSFLNQLAFVGSGQGEVATPVGQVFAGVPVADSAAVGGGLPLQASTVSCASHGLQAAAVTSGLAQLLPNSWDGTGCDWEEQQQQPPINASSAAAQQPGWLLGCDGDGDDDGDDQAYGFAVFPGFEDEDGESKGACAASLASIFSDAAALADLDMDNLDMACLDMAEGKQSFVGMIHPASFSGDHDGNSVSSDSAISMDVPSTFEDLAESSPPDDTSDDTSDCAACADERPGSAHVGSVSSKSRSKRIGALSGSSAAQHNHTYTAPPGGRPHVRKMDMKKQAQNDTMSRDERSAKELGLPFSVDAVVSAPVDEFNALMRSHVLTDEQTRLVRDIRRRGKNKVAAQNCRRRKLGALVELGESLESLRERRHAMLARREALRHETSAARGKLAVLYDDLFSSLRTERGAPYESSRFELRLAGEATRRLLLLPTTPGPGIGAAALREAIASSTSLLPAAAAGGGVGGAVASTNLHERHSAGSSGGSGRARSHAASQK